MENGDDMMDWRIKLNYIFIYILYIKKSATSLLQFIQYYTMFIQYKYIIQLFLANLFLPQIQTILDSAHKF